MDIQFITTTKHVDWQQVCTLFETVGWPARCPNKLESAFNNSTFKYFAYHKEQLVGIGRTVDDGSFYAWVVDLAIHPNYQGHGLGAIILDHLEKCLSSYDTTMLTAALGKSGFYEKQGWRKQRSAYIFPRSDEQIIEFVLPEQTKSTTKT
ncbi:GNAT family N-acetyltransferase [Pseudoalteromonas luteoviolacea]|uniref:GNAT family N-acetyltransferase n=1 Tax=Pseudoalteromonas luteoviolacea TaxID=43657 RepID=UPI001F16147D|nr:GNAT family N-acetyltransferase [Pseudoalteromonas luteoviolacea]MCF6440482.1 GNAT family N-acetyltransferase [Pseudoalteromonas luteoviolacea]